MPRTPARAGTAATRQRLDFVRAEPLGARGEDARDGTGPGAPSQPGALGELLRQVPGRRVLEFLEFLEFFEFLAFLEFSRFLASQ